MVLVRARFQGNLRDAKLCQADDEANPRQLTGMWQEAALQIGAFNVHKERADIAPKPVQGGAPGQPTDNPHHLCCSQTRRGTRFGSDYDLD